MSRIVAMNYEGSYSATVFNNNLYVTGTEVSMSDDYLFLPSEPVSVDEEDYMHL